MSKEINSLLISLMVVEPNIVLRESIISNIEKTSSSIQVNASCSNNEEAIELAKIMKPNVILINFENLALSNYKIIHTILKFDDNIKVIAYSIMDRYQYIEKSLAAGANGFVDLGLNTERIVKVIKSVYHQLSPFVVKVSHEVTGKARSWIGKLLFEQLSGDEKLILEGMLKGYKTSEISDMTSKDIKTIQREKAIIKKKLDVRTDFELLFFALQEGYYKLENYNIKLRSIDDDSSDLEV